MKLAINRHTALQIVRRCVQGSVILLVAGLALLSLYAHYRAAHVIEDEQLMAGLRGETAAKLVHPLVDRLEDPQAFLDANKGTVWSMRLLGVSITDPLAAAEAVATTKRIHVPLLLSVIIPVLLTVLLGKVFCSWICPAYVLFEVAGKLRRLLRLAEIRPGEVKFAHANKYVFLVIGLVVAAIVATPFFALVYPPAVMSRAIHAWIFGTELAGMIILLGIAVAFEVFVSPRWWCRSVCPGGALYGILGWARPVRVTLARDACTGCRACIPVCEAGIDPITESSSIECDNCAVCLGHCEPGALKFTIAPPDALRERPSRSRKASGAATAHRVTTALVVLLSILATDRALGHHVLGLPHYSYKENYPQRPTLEYPATTGPYDVLFTSYPGMPTPGEPANLAFYVKDRERGVVYAAPVTVRVLETSTFGDNRVIVPATRVLPFDNQHKIQCTFPRDAEYVVELSLEVEGRQEVIPFLVVAGEPTATTSIVLAAISACLVVFVVARAVQKKRQRRRGGGAAHPEPLKRTTAPGMSFEV